MQNYEIFVKPNSQMKQMNPMPKFDLIYENLKAKKTKESDMLANLKRRTKSQLKMVHLPSLHFI